MKKILMATVTGVIVMAGTSYAGDKACPKGMGAGFGCMGDKSRPVMNRKFDDLDKLLMLVSGPKDSKRGGWHNPMGMQRAPMQWGRNPMQQQCPMQVPRNPMMQGPHNPMMQCPMQGVPQKMMKRGMAMKGGHCKMSGKQPMQRSECGMMKKHGMRRGIDSRMLKSYLLKNYSKEVKEIVELKKSSDDAAKNVMTKFKALVEKAQAEIKVEQAKASLKRQKLREMIEQYKKSKDAKLAEQIKAQMAEFYEKRLEFMQSKIDSETAKIQKDKETLDELRKNKSKTIEQQLEKMTK
jgi:hypothetical protein